MSDILLLLEKLAQKLIDGADLHDAVRLMEKILDMIQKIIENQ